MCDQMIYKLRHSLRSVCVVAVVEDDEAVDSEVEVASGHMAA